MEPTPHDLQALFEQLGLPGDEASITAFVAEHRPLPAHKAMYEAPFWTPSQVQFLREGVRQDAEWAHAIDSLSVMLIEAPDGSSGSGGGAPA